MFSILVASTLRVDRTSTNPFPATVRPTLITPRPLIEPFEAADKGDDRREKFMRNSRSTHLKSLLQSATAGKGSFIR